MMEINHTQRAYKAWSVLTGVASRAPYVTVTYGQLASAIGIHHRAVRYVLGVIQDYCLTQKLPPLTILVVNGQNGQPGSGFIAWDADDLATGFEQVAGYSWHLLENPFAYAADGATEERLADELAANPARASDVYALVKVRGVAQSIFRRALLRVYGRKCAFCGISFIEILEAAHIVPWGECDASQRLSTANGLLLCATHHGMFDSGLITMGPNYTVEYADPLSEDRAHSREDRVVSIDLDGRPAFMPKDRIHWPSSELLKRHYEAKGWDFC